MPKAVPKSQPLPRAITATSTCSRAHDAVGDLVHRPVAADDDEQLRAPGDRVPRELGQVTRPFREERVALEPEGRGPVGELGPAPARGAVAGRRVDEEDSCRFAINWR